MPLKVDFNKNNYIKELGNIFENLNFKVKKYYENLDDDYILDLDILYNEFLVIYNKFKINDRSFLNNQTLKKFVEKYNNITSDVDDFFNILYSLELIIFVSIKKI